MTSFFEGEGGAGGGGGGWVGIDPVSVGTGRTKAVVGIQGAAVCKVVLRGVSASAATGFRIRVGNSEGEKSDGYKSEYSSGNLGSEEASTAGFDIQASGGAAGDTLDGTLTLTRAGGNKWVAEGTFSGTGSMIVVAGEVDLGDEPLDRVSVSILSTTDTVVFDAGEISVRYSGDSLTVPAGGVVTYTLPPAGDELGGAKTGGDLTFTGGTATIGSAKVSLDKLTAGTAAAGSYLVTGSGGSVSTGSIDSKIDNRADARIAAADSDDISEGSANLYFTDARADARVTAGIAAADSDDISEGSANLYFTDARARGALSSSGIVSYSSAAGVIGTDVSGLASEMQSILQAGTNVDSINLSGNRVVINAATQSGGGGGGSSTLRGLDDTNLPANSDLVAGRPLLWDGTDSKWEQGLLNGGQIAGASIPITALSGISGNGTDGQVLASNGSGAMKLVTPDGIGLSDFPATATALQDGDTFLIGVGSSLNRMTKRNTESQIRPVHVKTDIAETGYVYKSSGSPSQSHVRLFDTATQVIIGIVAKTGFEIELDEILQPKFLIQVRNADSTKFRYGLVSGRSGSGANNFWLATMDRGFLREQGTFANDEALIFESFGQFVPFAEYADQAEAEAGVVFDKWMSPRAVKQFFDQNIPALQYTAQFDRYVVTGTGAIADDGDMKVNTSNREWTIRTTASEWAEVDPVLRKGSGFSIVDRSDSSVKQAGTVESVNRSLAGVSGDRVISFKYESGPTGTLTNATEIDDADVIFTAPQAAANRKYVLEGVGVSGGLTKSTAANGDITISGGTSLTKASAADMRAGSNDTFYSTPLGVKAAIDYDKTSDIPEATLTGMNLIGGASLSAANQIKVNTGNFMNIRLTPARYREIEPLLHHGNTVQLIDSGGESRYSAILDRDEEFDLNASTDDLVLNMESDGGLALDQTYTGMTLKIRASWADEWEEAVDAFLTTNLSAQNSSVVVTHATGTGHGVTIGIGTITAPLLSGIDSSSAGNLTISSDGTFGTATGGGGGGTFATTATATAGQSTNTIMSPATTHAVVEHLAHVASYVGFTYVTSGNDMGAGTWWINSAGTQMRARGHSAAETQTMLNEFLIDRDCILERSGARLDFGFTDVTAITQGTNSVVQATITNHRATPANPTLTGTDWVIRILPEQNAQILNHAPAGSIPNIALEFDAHAYLHVAQRSGRNQIPSTNLYNVFPRSNNTDGANPLGDAAHMEFEPHSAGSKFLLTVFGKPGWLSFDYTLDLDLRIQRVAQNEDGTWPSWLTSTSDRTGAIGANTGTNSQTLVQSLYAVEWRRARGGPAFTWEFVYIPTGDWRTAKQRLRCEIRRRNAAGSAGTIRTAVTGTIDGDNNTFSLSLANTITDLRNNPSNSWDATSFDPFVFKAIEFI